MLDLLLLFPPQWSPFQPPLSLPSLSAWLRRAGFKTGCVDANLAFYEWLLSDQCAHLLVNSLESLALSDIEKRGLEHVFLQARYFRADVDAMRAVEHEQQDWQETIKRTYLGVHSLSSYLRAVSMALGNFSITSHSLQINGGALKTQVLNAAINDPPAIFVSFANMIITNYVAPTHPKMVGFSCIGQEQLFFTMLLGRMIRHKLATPVVVGGTVLSRIFERGVLKPQWFSEYFDIIVRSEGERPCEALLHNLSAGRDLCEDVGGLIYHDGETVIATSPCRPLEPTALPIPDFDDLPVGRYLSPRATLPILSARGCYWGKCEFCHHGMVYGEKYSVYSPDTILTTVEELSRRYSVRQFSFNDEAIPPKMIKYIGDRFPPHRESGWTFTGLIRFERYYNEDIFYNAYNAGFRALYVGLESASERVLALMNKATPRETIVSNLRSAAKEGIWTHCFLFFGFPGETDEEAEQTFQFVLDNWAIIGSIGWGTFSLEHNAPIFRHPDALGVVLDPGDPYDLDVYYRYAVTSGISQEKAAAWANTLAEATRDIPKYSSMWWVPREHLLCLLSCTDAKSLVRASTAIKLTGMPESTSLREMFVCVMRRPEREAIIINRITGSVSELRGRSCEGFQQLYDLDIYVNTIKELNPSVFWAITVGQHEIDQTSLLVDGPEQVFPLATPP